MTSTLADMTPEEQAQCIGMWCEISGRHLAVLADIWEHGEGGVVYSNADLSCYDFAELAPRFDLPRAWTPDGEPADMDIETGRVEYGRIWYGSEIMERTNLPDGTTVHRHVTDWEEV